MFPIQVVHIFYTRPSLIETFSSLFFTSAQQGMLEQLQNFISNANWQRYFHRWLIRMKLYKREKLDGKIYIYTDQSTMKYSGIRFVFRIFVTRILNLFCDFGSSFIVSWSAIVFCHRHIRAKSINIDSRDPTPRLVQ